MKLTGHKTESIYKRYAIVSEADLSEGLKKLATLHPTRHTEQIENRYSCNTIRPFCGSRGGGSAWLTC